ncbi:MULTISPECIES: hypothetical protein [unclassified Massilia]|uniref:hypothetical protein n=1 Tax=unclassified Massilia TaxID=2609279 RepID=UPI001B8259A2|nr:MULTISPECIES: hypothetical protein [unclassified Massilia]MBQ5939736.1 hypothetical protein [Massilia sp. AB1]MBQ5965488.1 hypothetical protein [Massilia sp. ZL223]
MTHKIGNKNEAQHRGKKERLEIKRANVAREAVRQAEARAKYRNQPKGQAAREAAASA